MYAFVYILIFELYTFSTFSKTLIQLNTRGKRKWELIPGTRAKHFSLRPPEKWTPRVPGPGRGRCVTEPLPRGGREQCGWQMAQAGHGHGLPASPLEGRHSRPAHRYRAMPTSAPQVGPESLLPQLLTVCDSRSNQTAEISVHILRLLPTSTH